MREIPSITNFVNPLTEKRKSLDISHTHTLKKQIQHRWDRFVKPAKYYTLQLKLHTEEKNKNTTNKKIKVNRSTLCQQQNTSEQPTTSHELYRRTEERELKCLLEFKHATQIPAKTGNREF